MGGDDGSQTWETMASVPPARMPALLAEVSQVLAWAHRHFPQGPLPLDEGGEWDLLLQAQADDGLPHTLAWDPRTGHVTPPPVPEGTRWVAVTLTLGASLACAPAFEDALHGMGALA